MCGPINSKAVAVLARFTGRVQGVGFRYTAVEIAQRLPVTGYVRNEGDGSVELLAEGPAEAVDRLLVGIRESRLGPLIRNLHTEPYPPTGRYASFSVSSS
jgi:acylphosphatase